MISTVRLSVDASLPAEFARPFFAWCETCGEPVEEIEQEIESISPRPEKRIVRPELRALPCGHGRTEHGHVVRVGTASTVGEGVGPLPSVSIAGFDPSRTWSPPMPIP